jgi:hypothetical protein
MKVTGDHCTKVLCLENLQFFSVEQEIPHSHHDLHLANTVSITFIFKKNDKHDATITQHQNMMPPSLSITLLTANYVQSSTTSQKGIFYPHKILFEIHRVFSFFCFRMLIFMDFIQSPIIFFGNVTSQIQDWLQIFQVGRPRFSVVTLNEKMCSSPPEGGLLFFYAPKANCSPFQFVIFSYPLGMDRIVLCFP